MGKVSQTVALKRAEDIFFRGDFSSALHSYALILQDYPLLDEAKVGVLLSDLGFENKEEAQALFDYYYLIKNEKKQAKDIIENLISSLETTRESLESRLLKPLEEQLDYADGIGYSDFLVLVKSRGSFKEAFEDIMFSTKVVIRDKDEFIDFVRQLWDEGFDEMALGYLDATTQLFGNDQDILALYNVVRGTKE